MNLVFIKSSKNCMHCVWNDSVSTCVLFVRLVERSVLGLPALEALSQHPNGVTLHGCTQVRMRPRLPLGRAGGS